MTIEVKVPVLPESVEDATIASWHKKAGERVRRDDNLVDLETDKVVLEVPAPADGILQEIKAVEGDTVLSGQLLALIEEGAIEQTSRSAGQVDETAAAATAAAEMKASDRGPPAAPSAAAATKLSPAARRVIEEGKIDPTSVPASGRGGRITKGDVLSYKKSGELRQEQRVKMTRLRNRIAERMKDAQNTAALLTTFNEVDLKEVMGLRNRHGKAFLSRHGIKLGLMAFFVKACCDALRKFPMVNASIDGDEIVYHNYQDIGIAVSTERGLIVPILRHAEIMGLAEIEQNINEFAKAARDGSIRLADLQGGTFTITNGGVFGSLLSTPLLNPPQSAILGMHAIKERAVVVDGEILARPMMYLALTYDHRLIDGKDAVQFLVAIKETLEDPARLLLGL